MCLWGMFVCVCELETNTELSAYILHSKDYFANNYFLSLLFYINKTV